MTDTIVLHLFRTPPVLRCLNLVENVDNKKKTALKKLECVRFFLREAELRRFQEYRFSVEEENISLDEDEGLNSILQLTLLK